MALQLLLGAAPGQVLNNRTFFYWYCNCAEKNSRWIIKLRNKFNLLLFSIGHRLVVTPVREAVNDRYSNMYFFGALTENKHHHNVPLYQNGNDKYE